MKRRFLSVLLSAVTALVMMGCTVGGNSDTTTSSTETEETTEVVSESGTSSLKGQNVRVVIGSTSTSGDSYMIADIVTRYLAEEMGFNGKVDAVGNAEALDAIANADGDGKTIMMFHDMTYLSVLFGAVDEKYALENMTVGPRIGQNPGGCFGASASKPYASLSEVTQYLIDNPDETVSFNIESGGTSHITFAAYYLDVQEKYGDEIASRIKVIVGGTTAEKLQRLWDGNADVIYGDTSAFEQYTLEGVDDQLAMTMFDSGATVDGVDIQSMADDGIEYNGESFDFAKDFAMYFPADMDESVLAEYEAAMQRVCENEDFQAEMAKLYYTTLSADEVSVENSSAFIYEKREMCEHIIGNAPDLDTLTQ